MEKINQQSTLYGITGDSHTFADDIFRKMAPGLPTPGPAYISHEIPLDHSSKLSERTSTKQKAQAPITSMTIVIATSNAAGGNNRLKPSTYTPLVPKTAIFEAMTRCSQILGTSTVQGGQLFPINEASE